MKKLKLYLDTSVISHLKQDDVPDKMADTLQLWEEIKAGLYEIVISDVTFSELSSCPPEKQLILSHYIDEIKYVNVSTTTDIEQLATEYITDKILTPKSYDDCLHLATATIAGCDIVVSWNFKHMVRYKTIEGVRITNAKNGYHKVIDIIQPSILIERGDINE